MTSTETGRADARRTRVTPAAARGCTLWSRCVIRPFFAVLAALAVQSDAYAFVFITPPGQAEPWSRSLWPGLIRNDANLGRVMDLEYTFGNAGVAVDPGGDAVWGTADDVISRAFTAAQRQSVAAAAATWNNARNTAANGNVVFQPNMRGFDLQSTALHELGHALGLGHPNYADRPADRFGNRHRRSPHHGFGNNRTDDLRSGGDFIWGTGDDVAGDDVLLNISPLSPYVAPNVVDWISVQRSALVPTREQASRRGFADTEAVMVQGIFPQEHQRVLGFDDLQGLMALETGRDFLSRNAQTRADDFRYQLVPGGAGAPITIYNANLLGAGGATFGSGGPNSVLLLDAIFAFPFDEFGLPVDDGEIAQVMGLTEIIFNPLSTSCSTIVVPDADGNSDLRSGCVTEIVGVNVFLDVAAHDVAEPNLLALLAGGVLALRLVRRRARAVGERSA